MESSVFSFCLIKRSRGLFVSYRRECAVVMFAVATIMFLNKLTYYTLRKG